MIRATTMDIAFRHPFALKGLGSAVPPGTCRIDIEEEQIDGLSFPPPSSGFPWPAIAAAARTGWSIRRSWSGRAIRRLMRQRSEGRSVQRRAGDADVHAMEGAW